MRRLLATAALSASIVMIFAAFAMAGVGVKVETTGLDKYVSAGLDTQIGLPMLPIHITADIIGWPTTEGELVAHAQAGAGARLYLSKSASGLFLEGKMRYFYPFVDHMEPSTYIVVGGGYRIKPLIGGVDVFVAATLQEHDIVPQYAFGARIGF